MELDHIERTYQQYNKRNDKKLFFKEICHSCGKVGHYVKDCRSKPKAKVTSIEEPPKDIELTHIEENKEQLLYFNGKINGNSAWILLDSDASRNFVD